MTKKRTPRPQRGEPRIALRLDDGTHADPAWTRVQEGLDDVYVKDVDMFRAEMMDDGWLWMCCYLRGEDTANRIAFAVQAKHLRFSVTEMPTASETVTFEE